MPRSSDRDEKDLQSAATAVIEEAASVVEDAAAVVESAAAVVQDAAAVVQEAAAAESAWPAVERRKKPRLLRRLHDEGKVQWKHIALYAPVLLLVILIGAYALWSFFEKQSVRGIEPAPLPKVTLITTDPRSPSTAAWVRLLTDAELQPTLVPLDHGQAVKGVVVLCNVAAVPPQLGKPTAVAVVGQPPSTPVGPVALSADSGMSDNSFKLSSGNSPLLARLTPGRQVWVRPAPVAFLKETADMSVDARWSSSSRAVIMHMERDGTRVLWFGFDPNALSQEDRQLMLLLRTAFRWVAGQPVSDGAVGSQQTAQAFSPAARDAAHAQGFVFSVDALRSRNEFRVWMTNRGKATLQNPTVKVWLPPGVTRVSLGGDFSMKRNVTVTALPDEDAWLVSVPRLVRGGEKVIKLVVERQPPK